MSTPTTSTRVSRVGKRPVPVPAGVTVTLSTTRIEAKGPKGTFAKDLPPNVEVAKQGNDLHVKPKAGLGVTGAKFQGLARALVKNVIEGVSKGYDVALDLIGTGYRAELKGQDRAVSERFIIGTFASTLWAAACAGIAIWLLRVT